MVRTRLLLVDDCQAFLAELCQELKHEFDIVGTVTNGSDAIDAVSRFDPDIVILDIAMPMMNGIEVSSRLRESHPRTKILFVTMNVLRSGNREHGS